MSDAVEDAPMSDAVEDAIQTQATCSLNTEPVVRRARTKVPWSAEELEAVKVFFKAQIQAQQLPNQRIIIAAQEKYPILQKRKWLTIRAKVRYLYTSN